MEKVAKPDVPDQFPNFLTHPLNHPVTVTKNKPDYVPLWLRL